MRPTSREIARLRVVDALIDEAMRSNINGDSYTKIKRLRVVRLGWINEMIANCGIKYWKFP